MSGGEDMKGSPWTGKRGNDRELVGETPDSLELSAILCVRRRSTPAGGPQVRGYGEWPKLSEAWLRGKRGKVI